MARALPVPALGLELEHAQLRAALVTDDLRLDADLLERVGVEHRVVGAKQERLQCDALALGAVKLLDQQRLPGLDPVLLAAGLDDRVCHGLLRRGRGLGRRARTPAATSAAPALGLRW